MPELDPSRRQLAEAYGVATDYWDWQGRHTVVAPETIEAVLAALGVDASSPAAAEASLAAVEDARWRRPLAPSLVVRQGRELVVSFFLRDLDGATLRVDLEDGGRRDVDLDRHVREARVVDGSQVLHVRQQLPEDLPLGYHALVLRAGGVEHTMSLTVTPAWLGMPAALGERRLSGLAVQLYSVRSRGSWGVGDLADLAALCRWSGAHDAGYILINPLHAAQPVPPMEPSPYLPTTRRFVNPLYLRVEDVPEYARLEPQDRARVDRLGAGVRDDPEAWQRIDRDAAWAAKREALALLHAVPREPDREAAFAAYREQEGPGLVDFATWNALALTHGADWTNWPEELRHPDGPAVRAYREAHADQVDFACWLQWLLDEQLAAAQRAATEAGMELGVMKDLAVGVHPTGAETWGLRGVYAEGVGVGAPPDAYNQNGQNWNQPPWRPDQLAETGYRPFRDLVATVLHHAGGVRVDHVVGLFRLWWIPEGMPPTAGTYVRYDHEAMVGILALEAHRAGAVVVGEDLGTVEPSARDYLRERGILGTSILWFEGDWDGHGGPLEAHRWREYCLASVTTHDLPPTAAYLAGDHVRLRDRLGLLTRPLEEELAVATAERRAWLDRLRVDGLLPDGEDASVEDQLVALHAFLARTPARLLGVALTDAVEDRRTQNQPGTVDEYPNWRVPLSGPDGEPVLLEDALDRPSAAGLLRAVRPAD